MNEGYLFGEHVLIEGVLKLDVAEEVAAQGDAPEEARGSTRREAHSATTLPPSMRRLRSTLLICFLFISDKMPKKIMTTNSIHILLNREYLN